MRIAMFGHKHIPSREGGVEVAVEALSTRMVQLGHQVTCYNRGGTGSAPHTHNGVRLKTVWTLNRKGLAAVTSSFCAALCSALSPVDVVHIHSEGPAFMCWLPKLFGKRVIVTIHGLDWQREKWARGLGAGYIHGGEKMAVRFADEIIVLSRSAQHYFKNTYHRDTVRIPNGVDTPEIGRLREIKEPFGLQPGGYILYVGRLVPEKGIHYLIEAFRHVRTDKKLVIAGAASDTEAYTKRLHSLAAGNHRILFTGFVQGSTLAALYSNAYVYVLPSDLEGMSLSLLEALGYGSCCLVSDIPECTEVVEDRAVTFRKGSVADLRMRLQTLCDDPALVAAYREKARSCIRASRSWQDVTEQTLELYR